MTDLAIALDDRPGALAELGEALGRAGVSIEGGGAWSGVAHFLFADGGAARRALEAAGIRVVAEREVVLARLPRDPPGQLGRLARRLAEAGVTIEVMYTDHEGHKVLVVDDEPRARAVAL